MFKALDTMRKDTLSSDRDHQLTVVSCMNSSLSTIDFSRSIHLKSQFVQDEVSIDLKSFL